MEDIDFVLDTVGVNLDFDAGIIKGIPGFSTTILYKGEVSLYEVERQNFTFKVSTLVCLNFEIGIDLIFTMSDTSYTYTFQVDRTPVQDLTGWSTLYANYISKEAI